MDLYAISDLHLSFGADKPMDVFSGWDHYVERLTANWNRLVTPQDVVVLPGDFSWGLKLDETIEDFRFLEQLPGQKILLKGNHDLWWPTVSKITAFFKEQQIQSVRIVYNDCILLDDCAVCGSRGWSGEKEADRLIIRREAGRLERSLQMAKTAGKEPIVFMHFPPAYANTRVEELLDVLKAYDVQKVYHGHIHGGGSHGLVGEADGITLKPISCDLLSFTPLFIRKIGR